MQSSMMLTIFLALSVVSVEAARLQTTPMARVVGLLTELEAKIESEGKIEQKSYDKYACWCEATLGRKATDIANEKELIDELQASIIKLKAEIASHGAEIEQLTKDIAANLDSRREATELREKESGEYSGEKTESEQCIGALEAAIKVLTGAGENRGAFLATSMGEAQLLSVVSGVRGALKKAASKSILPKDPELVKRFVEHPENFVADSRSAGVFAQVGNNPFGDYAPQSTQVQGILKGMYDAFTGDLEKDNSDEADAQKAYEELMATKKFELETLQTTLDKHEQDHAEKSKKMADDTQLRDDTKEQLKADEKFFEETKSTCQTKAAEWSERSRLRTEELMGMGKAIQIMSSPEAQKIFTNATTTFVQIAAKNVEKTSARNTAFAQLRKLATSTHNMLIGQLAAEVKTGGHFDKVIVSIDSMIALLRQEEQDDIAHRDRCQRSENKNSNDMADLNHEIEKSNSAIDRLGDQKNTLEREINALDLAIKDTKSDMKDLLEMRNDAVAEFKQAMEDDVDAIALLEKAVAALSSFYKRNQIAMELMQKKSDPEYSVDKDKAPELVYDAEHRADQGVGGGASYGGRKGETGGIVAIIRMLVDDLEKEVTQSKLDDAEAEKLYEEQKGALEKTLNAQQASKISTEKELSATEAKIADTEEYKDQKGADLSSEQKLEQGIYADCSWVATHFQDRRDKRKAEMDGLEEAKNFLAGVEFEAVDEA